MGAELSEAPPLMEPVLQVIISNGSFRRRQSQRLNARAASDPPPDLLLEGRALRVAVVQE